MGVRFGGARRRAHPGVLRSTALVARKWTALVKNDFCLDKGDGCDKLLCRAGGREGQSEEKEGAVECEPTQIGVDGGAMGAGGAFRLRPLILRKLVTASYPQKNVTSVIAFFFSPTARSGGRIVQ